MMIALYSPLPSKKLSKKVIVRLISAALACTNPIPAHLPPQLTDHFLAQIERL
jgi:hypothetical protein